eukprot:TRINITY_DN6222_c0_g1_i1.p1 TRINITY_DN6222_c0_g1~~TRINITY_DN6222_c0_g1_i1.p1  ORF type:complete len:1151 (+),score=340.18 TRINITY_DN6222_c0_g1_i1:26-3454(+)
MSSQPFIAVVRRCPGGKGYKMCRNIQLDSIPHPMQNSCIPPEGGAENLKSYLVAWPKRLTTFMNYGTSSIHSQHRMFGTVYDNQTRTFSTRSLAQTKGASEADSAAKDANSSHQLDEQYVVYGSSKSEAVQRDPSWQRGTDGSSPSSPLPQPRPPTTLRTLKSKYESADPIVMVTAYDHSGALLADQAGIDMILVGDSLAMVMLGHDSTAPATMDQMISHTQSVRRGAKSSFVVADLPFGSYLTVDDALKNSARFVKECGADAIKLEGGKRIADKVRALVDAGFVVVGHIGLTPQTSTSQGGFVLQGKSTQDAANLIEDALELQKAGCFAIVLEMVPHQLAGYITRNLSIPTIGIGAGNQCSGQVLVYHDLLGLSQGRKPKLCKRYGEIGAQIQNALVQYRDEVRSRSFPSNCDNAFGMGSAVMHDLAQNQHQIHPEFDLDSLEIPHKPKRIVVVGGGAMGTLFASKLSQHFQKAGGGRVWLLSGWKEHVDKINQDGVQVSGDIPSHVTLKATSDPAEILRDGGEIDVAIVLVKGPATEAAAEKIRQILPKKGGLVITLQNGIGGLDILRTQLGQDRCVGGFTSHACTVLSPGSIRHTGVGNTTLILPESHPLGSAPTARDLADILSQSGISTDVIQINSPSSEAHAINAIWTKLITNAVINPLTAIFNVKNGEIAANSDFRPLISHMLEEIIAVARSSNIQLDKTVTSPIEKVLETARATGENTSSMLSDLLRGSPTEISFINGYLVDRARKVGLHLPVNSALVDIIKSLEQDTHVTARTNSQIISPLLASVPTSSSLADLFRRSHINQRPANYRSLSTISAANLNSEKAGPKIASTISQMRDELDSSVEELMLSKGMKRRDVKVGLVPTMGSLHSGHIQLVQRALEECDIVAVSIFVNQKQFAAGEDFNKYPRDLQKDVQLLSDLIAKDSGKKLFVFAPTSDQMYPSGKIHRSYVNLEVIDSQGGEGQSRPGFFRGVATVCSKLFNIIQPQKVYFGQKDGHQCIIIRKMVEDLNFPIDVVICETIREESGLALSSRNAYLSETERKIAPIIHKALEDVEAKFGQIPLADLAAVFSDRIRSVQQAEIKPEILYISMADAESGEEIQHDSSTDPEQHRQILFSVGVRIGSTRLIDNVILKRQ